MSFSRLLLYQNSSNFYHSSCVFCKSHYEKLGLKHSATHAEVKTAFYRLSKLYHPDTNANDPNASEKFREVLEAYEVLSNSLSRAEYDQHNKHSGTRVQSTRPSKGFKVPEDPQAAFYKSRLMKRMEVNPTYNFDEWTQHHYRTTFHRTRRSSAAAPPPPSNNHPMMKSSRHSNTFAYVSVFTVLAALVGLTVLEESNRR